MGTLLLIVMLIAGIAMSFAILLMAPKGGLGFGLGGAAAGSNEYGTKKSLETSLKLVATVGAIIFVLGALIYPFTKPKTFDADAVANSGVVAPAFDLGGSNASGVEITDQNAPTIVVGSGE